MRRPTSSEDRIGPYFEEMKAEYETGGKYSVYVIHLREDIKQEWNKRGSKSSFPREKFQNLEALGLVTHQGCVYVGYTEKILKQDSGSIWKA